MSTSHVALEVALQTKPNLLLLTEEVDQQRMSLRDVINEVADIVAQRAAAGKNFGPIIVAEGLLEAIPEFKALLSELEGIEMPCTLEKALPELTQWSRALFQSLPTFIQNELLLERQSNAGLQLSALETERLIAELTEEVLKRRKKQGTFKGSFSPVCQFLGYQARCSMPSDFDSDYAYALGGTAAMLATSPHTGYMANVSGLSKPVEQWRAGGVPLTAMMRVPPHLPHESHLTLPLIVPRAVELEGNAFMEWCKIRDQCAKEELYENPGPIQFCGPSAARNSKTIATKFSYIQELAALNDQMTSMAAKCRPGCDPRKVRVANQSLATLNTILDELTGPMVEKA
jgi:diphosphate--fructose-6-phosphate 1-phosphotransferase